MEHSLTINIELPEEFQYHIYLIEIDIFDFEFFT